MAHGTLAGKQLPSQTQNWRCEMEIELKIDYDGSPYLRLNCYNIEQSIEEQLLEVFIRKAKENEVEFIKCTDTCKYHGEIKIRGKK